MLTLFNISDWPTVATRKRNYVRAVWAFGELRFFMEYKAKREGVPLVFVNPKYTSRECPECHCVDKRNRPARDIFKCISCGLEAMADYVAARNLASRARFNEPIVAPLFSAVTISLPSGGRS